MLIFNPWIVWGTNLGYMPMTVGPKTAGRMRPLHPTEQRYFHRRPRVRARPKPPEPGDRRSHLLPKHHGGGCPQWGHNEDPHDGKENARRRPTCFTDRFAQIRPVCRWCFGQRFVSWYQSIGTNLQLGKHRMLLEFRCVQWIFYN